MLVLSPTPNETLHHKLSDQPFAMYIEFVNMVRKQRQNQVQLIRPIRPNICTKIGTTEF